MSTSAASTDWGWKLCDGHFVPIATDASVSGTDNILNIVYCKCHILSQNPCSTMLCSCCKHGLEYVTACKNCCRLTVKMSDVPSEPDEDLEFFVLWMSEDIIKLFKIIVDTN